MTNETGMQAKNNTSIMFHVLDLLEKHHCTLEYLKDHADELHLLKSTKRQIDYMLYKRRLLEK